MPRSLIDLCYDLYLQKTNKGILFEVPICIRTEHGVEESIVSVWAKDEREAEERALLHASESEYRKSEGIQQKSLGVVLPKSHFKPKGFFRTVTSPVAVWRDPVYKKGLTNIFGSNGYRFGLMTKLSISGLKRNLFSPDASTIFNRKHLTDALWVNIVSMFIWASLIVLGIVFLILGFESMGKDRFVINWLNPYFVACIVCFFVGSIAEIKTVKDYFWIVKTLDKIEDEDNV
jgi:hypothetical protein